MSSATVYACGVCGQPHDFLSIAVACGLEDDRLLGDLEALGLVAVPAGARERGLAEILAEHRRPAVGVEAGS